MSNFAIRLKSLTLGNTFKGSRLQGILLKSNDKIDPVSITYPAKRFLEHLLGLPLHIPTIHFEVEIEVRATCVDRNLPSSEDRDTKVEYLDGFKSLDESFLFMFELVCSFLSIFHGIAVESSFSIMDDILCERSGRTKIETYSVFYSSHFMDFKQENHLKEIVK